MCMIAVISQLGMCCFKLSDYDGASQHFLTIVDNTQEKEEIADAWLNLACTSHHKRSWVLAEIQINKAKKLAPEDEVVLAEE